MIPSLGDWEFSSSDRLGGGGYAQVFRCLGTAPHHEAAIKVFDNPRHVATFSREVRALQAMAGVPGTLRLIDHGRDRQGRLCIVTNLAPGIRLDRHLREFGPLSLSETEALLSQVLAVLGPAHDRGLLHKDVSCFNLLMADTRFTLLDWGVSEPVGNGRSESIRAKEEFVAPECYYANHSPASDFYALGWLTVQALTGALPYHFAEISDRDYRLAAHCLERPSLPATITGPLRRLIANWLHKDPGRRLIGYHLPDLLAAANEGEEPDFSAFLDVRQLRHEAGYLLQAARRGVPLAQYRLAMRLLESGNQDAASYWLQAAAGGGLALAARRLAQQATPVPRG